MFEVITEGDIILEVRVKRGAPCGATWDAAQKLEGSPIEEAENRMGLESQFFCIANPSNFDPVSGKSSLHIAGDLHGKAMRDALEGKKKEG